MESNEDYNFNFENVEENKEESTGGVNSYIKYTIKCKMFEIFIDKTLQYQ